MLDITWRVFSQTGNIETYLLLKEMENVGDAVNEEQNANELSMFTTAETLNDI
ncbi:YqzL family protein [Oceanobacillus sp. FSL H7-0719]|uniref:YqzL family protein n=1 Tax=Oceanobacillus sp. FSL H7-0719 TaxID=2954507 RepID=UPI0032443D83